jgi:hypothetical protein
MSKPAFLSATVDVATKAELEELARRNHRSLSAEVRVAVGGHLALAGASRGTSRRSEVRA